MVVFVGFMDVIFVGLWVVGFKGFSGFVGGFGDFWWVCWWFR